MEIRKRENEMKQNYVKLNNRCEIPQIGLDVLQIQEDEDAKNVYLKAFEVGYHHIDIAHHFF